MVLMFAVGVPFGVWAGLRPGGMPDRVITGTGFLLYAAPAFWLGTLLLLGLGGTFPMDGIRTVAIDRAIDQGEISMWSLSALKDLAWHLVLPVFVLAYGGAAVISRYARTGVAEASTQPFVRAARARGLREGRVIRTHILRCGLLPLATLLGSLLPSLVGGSVVVERIFVIPGIGLLAWDAVMEQDVPVVMAVVTLTGILTMIGYLLSDLIYAWADPRSRRA
jgi:peptide/nickel transport system permease protein